MWDLGIPGWWVVAPLVMAPLALWKLIDIALWAASHISIH